MKVPGVRCQWTGGPCRRVRKRALPQSPSFLQPVRLTKGSASPRAHHQQATNSKHDSTLLAARQHLMGNKSSAPAGSSSDAERGPEKYSGEPYPITLHRETADIADKEAAAEMQFMVELAPDETVILLTSPLHSYRMTVSSTARSSP